MKERLMSAPSLLDNLDYNCPKQIANLLLHYEDLQTVAHKGYPAIMELYIEINIALSKIPNSDQLVEDIHNGEYARIQQHAVNVSNVLTRKE